MDYFFLQALVRQLQPQLQGALVNKVFQPNPDLLILRLWNGRQELRLLIQVTPANPCLYVTDQPYRNPIRPPRFSQLLRARLKRLEQLSLADNDRVVTLLFSGTDGQHYRLVVELFGREANALLLDEADNIIDVLRRSGARSERPLKAGQLYVPAPTRGDMALNDVMALADSALPCVDQLAAFLLERVTPMSRSLATRLQQRARQQGVRTVLQPFVAAWQRGLLQPCCVDGTLSMDVTGDEAASGDLSQFAQRELLRQPSAAERTGELVKVVSKIQRRLRKRLAQIEREFEVCDQAESIRQQADLLLAHRHLIKRGMAGVEVTDYYLQPAAQRVIELDSAKTPQQNIEHYFKRYRKAKRGLEHCLRRHQQTEQELAWIEQVAQQLENPSSVADLEVVREELIESGYYRPQTALQRETRKQVPAELVKRTQSPGGWALVWGRNNKTNDYVSKQLLKPRDLWFHAHNMPGCHVVLKCDGAEVAEEDLVFAAGIAAAYSKGAKDDKVAVMVTRGKHVKRPKGAPAGLVTVDEYQTLVVTPRPIKG